MRILKKLISRKIMTESRFLSEIAENTRQCIDAKATELFFYILWRNAENGSKSDMKRLVDSYQTPVDLTGFDVIFHNWTEKNQKEITNIRKITPDISFDAFDAETLAVMRKNFFWLGDESGRRVREKFINIIEDAFDGKIARLNELPEKLKEAFNGIVDKETRYFKDVADHIILQSQNTARVLQGAEHDVPYYKVVAVLDSRTTDMCRSMHGRVLPAEHVEKQAKKILDADTREKKKKAAKWQSKSFLGKTEKLPKNIGIPPYHFRCRTILQPVWVSEEEVVFRGEKIKTRSTAKQPDAGGIYHIDKTGTERYISNNVWEHTIHKKPGIKKLIAALNAIIQHAQHSKYPGRSAALSANNIVIIFEGDGVYTFIEPGNRKEALKYFKKTTTPDEKEIIKCGNSLSTFLKGMIGK